MKTGSSFVLAFLATLFGMQTPTISQQKAIQFGKLIDGSGKVILNAVVMVENDRISSVSENIRTIPHDVDIIDLSSYTGIPGLIDVHVHMTYYWDQNPGTNP